MLRSRSHRLVGVVVLLSLILSGAVAPDVSSAAPPTAEVTEGTTSPWAPPSEVVGPGVREAVAAAEQRLGATRTPLRSGGVTVVAWLDGDDTAGTPSVAERSAAAQRAQRRVREALPSTGVVVRRDFEVVPVLVFEVFTTAALDALAAHPSVRRLDLDVGGTGALATSVSVVGADLAHGAGATGSGTTVAVLDTGVDHEHPDLAGAVVDETCFGYETGLPAGMGFCPDDTDRQDGDGAAVDDAGHGTHVTGIVASRGLTGPIGVAPDTDIVAVKVLDDCSFSGCFYSFTDAVVAPLDWLAANYADRPIDVVNASLTTNANFAGDCDTATAWALAGAAAVEVLSSLGVVVIAAAGNAAVTSIPAPACLSGVVAVGASTPADLPAAFSNRSPLLDVFAPGVSVSSAAIGGGTITKSGTSMASPVIAGCAALWRGIDPALGPAALRARLRTSATVLDVDSRLVPRVDCDTSRSVPTAAPEAPSVAVEPSDGAFVISWTTNAPEGAPTLSSVVRVEPAGRVFEVPGTVTEVTVPGLDNGREHVVTVTSTNAIGTSQVATAVAAPTACDPAGEPADGPFADVATTHPFCAEIEWMKAGGMTNGYPDGTFAPADPVTRQAMVAFLHRSSGAPSGPVIGAFVDVPTGHPFALPIEWAAHHAIANGYADGTFAPGAPVTRQAAVAFMHRRSSSPAAPLLETFVDVPADHLFALPIEWAGQNGITTGFADGTFAPVAVVSRQAAAAFLYRTRDR